MNRPVFILTIACLSGVYPMWADARPHHRHDAGAQRDVRSSLALGLQAISYDQGQDQTPSIRRFAPGPIGPADRIPLDAVDHFGRGGVASIGYESGAAGSAIGAHELNAAFSSQQIGVGGVVGGGLSIHF